MSIMLRCPDCNSEKVVVDSKQKKVKKSDCFWCYECSKSIRIEKMAYSVEMDFDGELLPERE